MSLHDWEDYHCRACGCTVWGLDRRDPCSATSYVYPKLEPKVSNPYLRDGEHWDPYSRTWKKNLTEAEVQNLWPYSAAKYAAAKKEAPVAEFVEDWLEDALSQVAPRKSQPDTLTEAPEPTRPPSLEEAKTVLLNVMASADMAKQSGDAVVLPRHYSRFKLEPIRFICENNLNFFQGNIIKYVLRHDAKNGLEDLKKARRYLDMFIRFVEGDERWSE